MQGWSFTDVKAYGRWKNDASLLTYLDTVAVLQHESSPALLPLREAMHRLDANFAADWSSLPRAAGQPAMKDAAATYWSCDLPQGEVRSPACDEDDE